MNKRTEELMRMLCNSTKIEDYLHTQQQELMDCTLHEYLERLLQQYQMEKKDVIAGSQLNQIYGYQIFAGTKNPSRDKLIALIFGFPLLLEDAQRLLRIAKVSELYPRNQRDSIIIFGLMQKLPISELDDLLYEMGEKTISLYD